MNTSAMIQELKTRLARHTAVTVLTGAGISADSGVPTFRGQDGLWNNYRPEELASPEAFDRDPRLVWEWYNWRRNLIRNCQPNPAHYALVDLERRGGTFRIITQNVDGLHTLAGSQRVSEIHGNIWKVRCTRCGRTAVNREVPIAILPHCSHCQGLLRPHIVWFGESLDPVDLQQSHDALRQCELLLIIGTSGVVYPAASFGSVAKEHGAFVAELNRDPTPPSALVDMAIHGSAQDLVPQLLA